VLLLLVVAAYWPGMQAGFYFDDLTNIVEIPALHWTAFSLEALRQVTEGAMLLGRPLANLSFALNHLQGGLDPAGYHWVNLIIHLLVGGALAWVALLLATEQPRKALGGWQAAPYAVVAVALFLLHPLNIQAVTYVVQRMTSLSALFVLLALGAYLLARRGQTSRPLAWFALSAICWLLGLASKEIAIVLPALLLLYEACFHRAYWWRRIEPLVQRVGRWRLLWIVLVVVAVAIFGIGRLYYHPGLVSWDETFPGRDFTGAQRVLTEARIHFFYLSLLLWPAPSRLNLDHEFGLSLSLFQPWTTGLAVAGCLLALAGMVWLARRYPRYGFPLLGYAICHLLESGPINLELVFEHRMYLPMTFLAILITNLLVDFRPRLQLLVPLVLLLLLPLAAATHARNQTWSEPLTFLRDCAEKSPNKFRPWYNLGSELGRAGQFGEAEQALLKALAIEPRHSMANNQLGNVYLLTRRPQQAFVYYRAAVEAHPGNLEAIFNLALQYAVRGEREKAAELLRRFIEQAPPFLEEARRRAIWQLQQLGY
jgi:tetratricopeptide (TPR) repeat protein